VNARTGAFLILGKPFTELLVTDDMMGVMAEPLAAAHAERARMDEFNTWVKTEQRRIFLLCQRLLQDSEEAESAAQDSFFKAYKALQSQKDTIDEPAKWLTRIAVNTCLDRLRSRRWQFWRKRPAAADESLILSMAASGDPNAEDRMFALEIQKRLIQAMSQLSVRQRAVFTLRHYEGKSLDEIGQILELDTGTVKAHMARAVAKMRDQLRDLYGRSVAADRGRVATGR
jgi:RNA polymerase sigma-70 factor (ECF subfamily)